MSNVSAADLGLPEFSTSALPVEHAVRVAAVLDRRMNISVGDSLPLPWHWAFFTPVTPTRELGSDGHPRVAAGSPTQGFKRRMFAGGRVRLNGSLRVGELARRTLRGIRAEEKQGRSGALLVVTIEYEYSQGSVVSLEEEIDLVYHSEGDSPRPPVGLVTPKVPEHGFVRSVTPSTVLLFRFSAVTFNSHRIHYDVDYATQVEQYPAPVVQGPLTALLLAGAAEDFLKRPLSAFAFRATAPLFVDDPFYLVGGANGDGLRLRAQRCDGETAMTASAD